MNKILVIGGTETIGSEVVKSLLKKNFKVRVMAKKEENLKTLPQGVEGVVGDLSDKTSLASCFKEIEGVFFLDAISKDEAEHGKNTVEACKQANVQQIVYVSIHHANMYPETPQFKSKIIVEKAIKGSGISYTILRPTNFFQQDLMFIDSIKKTNTYPQPIGSVGVNRVDVRDIADAVANAYGNQDHYNKTYSLVGPDALTGKETAEMIGQSIGKTINYSDDINNWSNIAKETMPDWMIDELKTMYSLFQKEGSKASEMDFTEQEKILGHKPRTYKNFLTEISQSLKS